MNNYTLSPSKELGKKVQGPWPEKEQVYLVLDKSAAVVHKKIKADNILKNIRLNYIHETGQIKQDSKVIMIKFRQNIKISIVQAVFPRIIDWNISYKEKEKCAKTFNKIRKIEEKDSADLEKLMETGVSFDQLQKIIKKAEFPKEKRRVLENYQKTVKENLLKELKSCIVRCKTDGKSIENYASVHGKDLILNILPKKWEEFNKLEVKVEEDCIKPYCRHFNDLEFEEFIERKKKKLKLT